MSDVKNSSLATDLVSYWELEEASGTRVDSHGSNDLTDNNTVGQAAGKIGNAADFEVSNGEFLRKTSPTGLSPSQGTYASWVKWRSFPSGERWVADNGIADSGIQVFTAPSTNRLTGRGRYVSGYRSAVWTTTPTLDVWYHVVYTFTDTAVTLYVDGAQVAQTTFASSPIFTNNRDFALGCLNNGASQYCFDGIIDEAAVWSRAITASEVSDLYNSGAGIPYEAAAGGGTIITNAMPILGLR